MHDFQFERPDSVSAAVAALAGGDAQPLAGGQTLIPTLKARLASPAKLVSLAAIPQLNGVKIEKGTVIVGAATPHAEVARAVAGKFPALAALAGNIGDPAVRNRGTVGGSLANNDPSACYPAAALATGATIVTDRREIAADAFFAGLFETALEQGELITEVRFPIADSAAYRKFAQPASLFALVGAFVARFGKSVRVAITGASEEGVHRWSAAEEALAKAFAASALDSLEVPSNGLIEDIHGSAAYRANLVKVMTQRAVADAS